MPTTTKVGVIGTGYLGSLHARIYNELGASELVMLCDKEEKKVKPLSKKFKVPYITDYKQFPDTIEAVSIAVPTVDHFEIADYFLKKGIHVLVEKPITDKLETAESLLETAKQTNTILQVGHIERFNEAIQAIAAFIKQPLFIEVHRLSPFPFRNLEIGVVLDLMIHDIDIILTLVNSDITSIEGVGVKVLSENEDIANARLKFKNNCICNITASRISAEKMRKIRIFQKDSYISLNYEKQSADIYTKTGSKINKKQIPITKKEPLKTELLSFINTIQNHDKPAVSAEEATEALRIAKQIQKQIHTHYESISDSW